MKREVITVGLYIAGSLCFLAGSILSLLSVLWRQKP